MKTLAVLLTALITAYHPVPEQCDSTPDITASGWRSRPGIHCAVSWPLELRHDLRFGDKVCVQGVKSDATDGCWVFADRMSRRWKDIRIDLMLPVGAKAFKLENVDVLVIKKRRK